MSSKPLFMISCVFVLGLCLSSSIQAELIGWWRFEDGSGNTVSDSSIYGRNGEIKGTPQWTDGPEGYGLALDFSQTEGAYCGVFDPTGGTGTFTITLWCLWDGTQSIQHFCTKSNGWGATTAMFQIEVKGGHSDPARVDRLHLAYQGAPQAVLVLVPHNEWVHLALVFDGTNATGYRNGVDDVGPQPTGIGPNVDAPIIIGASHAAEGRTFQGLLDDVRIYDEVLSVERIRAIMDGGGSEYPFAYSPDPADGDLYADTWVSLSWKKGDFAVSHDVYMGENFDDVNDATRESNLFRGNQDITFYIAGFSGYAYPDGLIPGTTYYWRIDEVNDSEPNSPWKGDVWNFTIPPKTAYNPFPTDEAELVQVNSELTWTSGFGSKLHTIYFGEDFDTVNESVDGTTTGVAEYNPGPLELAKTYYWRVDEFDGGGTHKGEVWSFTTEGGVSGPNPANGSADVSPTQVLTWNAGAIAASHEVYFGTDADAVANASKNSPEYKGIKSLGEESYDPGKLTLNTTYYWRIEEVNDANPDSPWTGMVWSFTTGDFIVIDDFEGYDTADNQIWYAWHDGLGYGTPGTANYFAGNGTGAAVGDENTASYTEETIVHGGGKSMPLVFDNNKQGYAYYSEVEYTLTNQRDWTEEDFAELSIWFNGDSTNDAEPLYVAISNSTGNSAVVVHDDPAAAEIDGWSEWIIPLQVFVDQGIDLTKVDRIAIGLGTKGNMTAPGGSGKMFFDDVRLNKSRAK